ncbi:DUF1178 family protein [Enterovirga sp.]|jgi:hypothetical protein|uniref:DUF1178 family protein n=1 Tax=Enterovirga sp. TaxID=2026350 RepID=UPI002626B26A|nr:DUF1178 family protein [Enterovirga sp.]MDB5589721.1 hypothetical protein [Enterovirga sp.]
MIRYALACDGGHEFESWFPSASSYDAQVERGLVACPVCGSGRVAKQIMRPAVSTASAGARAEPAEAAAMPDAPTPDSAPPQAVALLSEREQAVRHMLRALREHVTKTSDYVGPSFAAEARRIHYGETPHRSIYGETDPAEARALAEEGIEVHALPVMPDDRN